ncbi:hypothetical protein M9H77_19308 [Catharanthus roseus]|uniref:Uncharacterized protein n=1 Tax=Catharanthus roseus TaxID=4058 RepID=A0ACC0B9X0_CATRO|nr:hypothetical protein M9H77_19308 [Catharanthus roseus]
MKIRLTLLPVPKTRIGDLTMYIPSRCIPATKNPLNGKFSSIPCPLVSTARLKQYLHFLNDVRNRCTMNSNYRHCDGNILRSIYQSYFSKLGIHECSKMCVFIPSIAEPLAALLLLHYVFGDQVDRIYRVQGSLELSFFRVIFIIRFRLTRNGIISVRAVNLIVIVIDGIVQHRRFIIFWQNNAQLLCVIFKDNAQQSCVILEDNT